MDATGKQRDETSRFLSFILRHKPGAIGITLDPSGWVSVERLLAQCRAHGRDISEEYLREIVATNTKRRFAFSADGSRIRASQGHSVDVELGYEPADPPETLFHGTVASKLASIQSSGLQRMKRHHVHLSADVETARAVGRRRGQPLILAVSAIRMVTDGHLFYLSTNGVWLTREVPPAYLSLHEGTSSSP